MNTARAWALLFSFLVWPASVCGVVQRSKVLRIGTSVPLKREGVLMVQGLRSSFNRDVIRSDGDKLRIDLDARDDKKSLQISLDAIDELKKKTSIVTSLFTNGVVEELLDDVRQKKLFVFAPREGSDYLRRSEYGYLIHAKPSLASELEVLITHAIKKLKRYTFAIFYEDSTFGRDGMRSARNIIKRYAASNRNVRLLTRASHPRGTVEITRAKEDIARLQPECVICLSRRHATYHFILDAIDKGLFKATFMGTSYLLPIQAQVYKACGISFVATSVVPPFDSTLQIVQEYKEALRASYFGSFYSSVSLESYIHGEILREALRVAHDTTPDGVIAAFESFKNKRFKGLELNFDAQTRNLMHQMWISPGPNGRWVRASG